jgi:hypothetical protein
MLLKVFKRLELVFISKVVNTPSSCNEKGPTVRLGLLSAVSIIECGGGCCARDILFGMLGLRAFGG